MRNINILNLMMSFEKNISSASLQMLNNLINVLMATHAMRKHCMNVSLMPPVN